MDEVILKSCVTCGHMKPLNQFYHGRRCCKPCLIRAQRKKRNQGHLEAREINELLQGWARV